MANTTESPTADICGHLIGSLLADTDKNVRINEIVHALSDRAYALIIMLLMLPNAMPGPYLPGLSIVTGLPALIFACEAMLGRPRPTLPHFVASLKLNRAKVIRHLERVRPYTLKLEGLMRPRLGSIVDRHRAAFAVCAGFIVILILPIPFGNLFMAWAIIVLTFALARRDGLFVLLGFLAGVAATICNVLLVVVGIEAGLYLIGD